MEEVLEMLCTLDTSKATGPGRTSAVILKATAESITKGITALFNKYIESGKVPEDWKFFSHCCNTEGSDSSEPSNYRPISLLFILKKLLERHIHKLIYNHLESTALLALQ